MAIMRRCCCFNDTRSGTLAAAIYILIYTIIFMGMAGWGFSGWVSTPFTPALVLTMYYLQFVVFGLSFVGSILAIVGVSKDIAYLLVPFIIAVLLMMIVEMACYVAWLALLGFAAILLILPFIIFLIFLGFNIVSLLCAISQFQELKEGRGRACDVAAANTTTTVIMTSGQPVMTHPPPGVFVVSGQQQTVQTVQYGHPGAVQQTQMYGGQLVQGQPPPAYGQPAAYGQPSQPTYPGQPTAPAQPAYGIPMTK